MRKALLLALVAVILVATVVVAEANDGDSTPPGEGVDQVGAIQPDAKEAIALFEDARSAVDAIPTDVAEIVDDKADFGMNPDLSRLAIGNASHQVYFVPARDHVCVAFTVGEGASLTCPETDTVAAGEAGPSTVSLAGGATGIFGIVPDGVDSVTLETGEIDSVEVPVRDNAYYVAVPAGTGLRTLDYTGPSGLVEFQLMDPRRAFDVAR